MDLQFELVSVMLLLPLLISIVLFFFKKIFSTSVISFIAIGSASITFFISLYLFLTQFNQPSINYTYSWIILPGLNTISTGLYLNNISLIMLLLVSGVSLLVQIFSIEYMKHDSGYGRYFAFLSFFTFSMLGIVTASNLLLLFIFWELVGFSSYLLIGFWFFKHDATQASKKAFIVNRIGDIGFLIGILILWSLFKTLDINQLEELVNLSSIENRQILVFLAGLGLFIGCIGKSAQFPLQIWLPDAMEGPTPVSALIHAATMVAAGIFLLARVFFLLDLDVLTIIAFVGGITAFMGAVAALTQFDIKKVLAYSTISQLGYMVMGIGVGAYQASLFHLITHAFFKAGLFLGAGAIIHSLHQSTHHLKGLPFDVQDMRLMGGLRKKLFFVFIIYFICTASLIGLPFSSGFLSKDAIIANSLSWANTISDKIGFISYLIPILGLLTVFLTALYMGRQIILIFFGNLRIGDFIPSAINLEIKKISLFIVIPLIVLGFMSLFLPFSLNPLDVSDSFLIQSLGKDLRLYPSELFINRNIVIESSAAGLGSFHNFALSSSMILALFGIGLAVIKYHNKRISTIRGQINLWERISFNNWYLDNFYQATILRIVNTASTFFSKLDERVIDPVLHFVAYFTVIFSIVVGGIDKILIDGVVNFSVYVTGRIGKVARTFQGGKVQYYFIIAILSLILLIYVTAF